MQINKEEKIDLKRLSEFLIKRSIIKFAFVLFFVELLFVWEHLYEFNIYLEIYVIVMHVFLFSMFLLGIYLNIRYYKNRVSFFIYKFTEDSVIVAFKGSPKIPDAELLLKYNEIKFYIPEYNTWLFLLPRGYTSIVISKKNQFLDSWYFGIKTLVKMRRIMFDRYYCGFYGYNIIIPLISKIEAENIKIFLLSKGAEMSKDKMLYLY